MNLLLNRLKHVDPQRMLTLTAEAVKVSSTHSSVATLNAATDAQPPMKLACNVDELCAQLGLSLDALAHEIKIDPRTLAKLNEPGESWALKRKQIEKLAILAFDAGLDGFFGIEHHPLWSSFEQEGTRIFRGTPDSDAQVEHAMTSFIRHKGGKPRVITTAENEEGVARAMRESNCIFVGSPRTNTASEIALCLLAEARPFDASPENRERVPIQMVGRDCPNPSAIVVPRVARHGFEVKNGTPSRHFVRVDWVPEERYARFSGDGEDAAMIVVSRSPLGTDKDVTSILILGYTALSTQEASHQLTHGEVRLTAEQLEQRGVPHLLSWRFMYRKPKWTNPRSSVDPRRRLRGSGHWSPPWN